MRLFDVVTVPISEERLIQFTDEGQEGASPQVAPLPEAKRYNKTKLAVSLVETILSFAVILFVLLSGYSTRLERFSFSMATSPYIALLIFAAALGLITGIVSFPLGFYSGFILEHKYQLSNQTLRQWLWEHVKALLVSIPIAMPLLLVFYFFLREYQAQWWLPVAIVMFMFSVLLSKIAPIVIMPLFYKVIPLEEGELKEKILALCSETKMNVKGIFTFNLSKTTKKANAGFTGIGKSKRIILGDTLMQHFSNDEIETVFAHELGHYVHGHIRKGILVGTLSIFIGLYATSFLYSMSLNWFGFSSPAQLAALPLLTLWLGIYSLVTSPLSNMLSRKYEFQADRYAIQRTGKKEAFISTMKKLAEMNLADTAPHPLVEFLFYSHPSIEKRIHVAEKL
ncbi:MAG: M48 family metallopeptidase [Bacteroidota bacterium]|nr:M48 family metallopeptidase [Bacteroidota bacterium]